MLMPSESTVASLVPTLRWFGRRDPINVASLRQAGAEGIVSSLHEFSHGEAWPESAIDEHHDAIESVGLRWSVVESVPVSESIKSRTGNFVAHIENFKTTLRRLGRRGPRIVCYNFMPVLDWVRTDLTTVRPDGGRTTQLSFAALAAFDLFILERPDARRDYNSSQANAAAEYYDQLDVEAIAILTRTIVDNFPGGVSGISLDDVRGCLGLYKNIGEDRLRDHLKLFLNEVLPVAEEAGVALAIHPDDPPYRVLGLPRVVSTSRDLDLLKEMSSSPAHGLVFCSGSLGACPDNDLVEIIQRHSAFIRFLHLRNFSRQDRYSFTETAHIKGEIDLAELLFVYMNSVAASPSPQIRMEVPFRPDHGPMILDDLTNPPPTTPGYSLIGRLKGLAELNGMIDGVRAANMKRYK